MTIMMMIIMMISDTTTPTTGTITLPPPPLLSSLVPAGCGWLAVIRYNNKMSTVKNEPSILSWACIYFPASILTWPVKFI